MITNPTDYMGLLENLQNNLTYSVTEDTVFLDNKKYYERTYEIPDDVSGTGELVLDTKDGYYVYKTLVKGTDYQVGNSIASWITAKKEASKDTSQNVTYYGVVCEGNGSLDIDSYSKNRTALLLPTDETIFNVDLDARTVTVPRFLAVQNEQYAETIYFRCGRYFDNMDLSTTTCVVQYINANGDQEVYLVPFVDVETYRATNEMLIPWAIGGKATLYPGDLSFSIRFYQIDNNTHKFIYNLSTKATTGIILEGQKLLTSADTGEAELPVSTEIEQLKNSMRLLEDKSEFYWKNV